MDLRKRPFVVVGLLWGVVRVRADWQVSASEAFACGFEHGVNLEG